MISSECTSGKCQIKDANHSTAHVQTHKLRFWGVYSCNISAPEGCKHFTTCGRLFERSKSGLLNSRMTLDCALLIRRFRYLRLRAIQGRFLLSLGSFWSVIWREHSVGKLASWPWQLFLVPMTFELVFHYQFHNKGRQICHSGVSEADSVRGACMYGGKPHCIR